MINKKYVCKSAIKHTPQVKVVGKQGWLRHDVASVLNGNNNIGIELGVAQGTFSKRMLNSDKFKRFYGVDIYGDTHNQEEYVSTLKYIGFPEPRYNLLRMDFESALELFSDEYFDFIYVDGFAHTGEEGGKTLIQWIKKLKIGGILAGDDYHGDWPLVIWAVNDLARQIGVEVNITLGIEEVDFCKYPTWYFRKEKKIDKLSINPLLYKIGMSEKRRIHKQRSGIHGKARRFIGAILETLGLKQLVKRFIGI
jgi:hypothetical protein